jgi:sugar phosphate permease
MQIVLSTFMAKINLRIYLTVTVAISAILTLLLGIAPSIEFVYFVCAFNGIVQAGIYSGCMSVLSKYLPFDVYEEKIVYNE